MTDSSTTSQGRGVRPRDPWPTLTLATDSWLAYLSNDGQLDKAQQMAAHASSQTTKLYDRRHPLQAGAGSIRRAV